MTPADLYLEKARDHSKKLVRALLNFLVNERTDVVCQDCGKAMQLQANDRSWKDRKPFIYRCLGHPRCRSIVAANEDGTLASDPVSSEIRKLRTKIHVDIIDPLWKTGKSKRNHHIRSEIYCFLDKKFGKEYHTANIKTVEEAELVIKYIDEWKGQYQEIKRRTLKKNDKRSVKDVLKTFKIKKEALKSETLNENVDPDFLEPTTFLSCPD